MEAFAPLTRVEALDDSVLGHLENKKKVKIINKNLRNTVPVDKSRFRGMFSEGLEKREIIAPVDQNDMFSVGFRRRPSGEECCANAVPADRS